MSTNIITSSNENELADIKDVLINIFQDDSTKLSQIDQAISLVNGIVGDEKIKEYTNIIKEIIAIKNENETFADKSIEMLSPIINIIDDLYDDFVSAKADMPTIDRNFVQNNIDVIIQVVILLACQELINYGLINKDKLTKILLFIKALHIADIDMTIKKCFACCKKNNIIPTYFNVF